MGDWLKYLTTFTLHFHMSVGRGSVVQRVVALDDDGTPQTGKHNGIVGRFVAQGGANSQR
jgi:hypothetical protein